MKIALIGNMNNNNFALMRFFIDLGHESHLFLFSNEGIDESEHFNWENDTYVPEKWKKFIHRTPLINGHIQLFSNCFFSFLFFSVIHKFFSLLNLKGKSWLNPGKYRPSKYLEHTFKEYDVTIGSGILPALFSNNKQIQLDLFYPYSLDIEFLLSPASTTNLHSKNFFSFIIRPIIDLVKLKQIEGLKKTNILINSTLSNKAFEAFNLKYFNLQVPLFYWKENFKIISDGKIEKNIIEQIKECDFSILMSSRQFWMPPKIDDKSWIKSQSKNNHYLIKAFFNFRKRFPELKSKIFLLDYGKDVDKTKDLIRKIGIEDHIVWINKLPRKTLVSILSYVDISVGEFYQSESIWGGTAIEALALGKPFINGFIFNKLTFEKDYGFPPPPFIVANSVSEIEEQIVKLYSCKNYYQQVSYYSKKWFRENHGIVLAEKWLEIIKKNFDS